jgi:AraC-like DNA-binding protein
MLNARSTLQRRQIVEQKLRSIAPSRPTAMELLASAIGQGKLTSRDAQQRSGVGERQWERLFEERTGIRPKLLERIGRFRRALALSREGLARVDIAQRCNYADQAHLVRDFRHFTGASPTRTNADLFG